MNELEKAKEKFIEKYQPLHGHSSIARKVFNKNLNDLIELAQEDELSKFVFWWCSQLDIGQSLDNFAIKRYLRSKTPSQNQEDKYCPNCGSKNITAWGLDADKCIDCKLSWDV